MFEAKTHYEQVPLDIVRKIVEEQILREIAIRQGQETKNRELEEDARRINVGALHNLQAGVIDTTHESQKQKHKEHAKERNGLQRPRVSRFGWGGEND